MNFHFDQNKKTKKTHSQNLIMTCSKCLFAMISLLVLLHSSAYAKLAPLLPEEYRANAMQNKFNFNGNAPGVNHTSSQTIYSSHAMKMLRTDSTSIENSISTELGSASTVISTIDFNVVPNLNTFLEVETLLSASCQCYNASWLEPVKSTFLRDVGAVWAGVELVPSYGMCQKWAVVAPGRTTITFYFERRSETFVGWHLVSAGGPQVAVGVETFYVNMQAGKLNPAVFEGSGHCLLEPPAGQPSHCVDVSHMSPLEMMVAHPTYPISFHAFL
jgi:hypothetical protein